MKKTAIFVLIFVFAFSLAYAHPPQDIQITFDGDAKILKAVITHITSNPDAHRIAKVDIGLNGKEIIEHKISIQDNNNTQAVTYLIPDARPGDIISVEAYCSISGTLTKQIKVK
ncbi:MAG: hypothetical protein AB1481_06985 [Candidatus Omnitrophota bacterium]